jgi:hypothetical protein
LVTKGEACNLIPNREGTYSCWGRGKETQQAGTTCTQEAPPAEIPKPWVDQNFKAPPLGGNALATPPTPAEQVGHQTPAPGAYSGMAAAIKKWGMGDTNSQLWELR